MKARCILTNTTDLTTVESARSPIFVSRTRPQGLANCCEEDETPRGTIRHRRRTAYGLAKLMASLQPGDIVVVTKLDRLGRSTRELLDLIERISKAGAAFRSLGDPLWDTSSSQGRLLSTLFAAIADFERDLIRERTGEGRKRAMANGVKFGRKPKLSPYQREEALKRRAAGEILASIAKSYAVDVSMISRLR
jgi:DNA invertase Pin-like site-specific DNA recombinase